MLYLGPDLPNGADKVMLDPCWKFRCSELIFAEVVNNRGQKSGV